MRTRAKLKCLHCEEPIPDAMIISWGQYCRALKRRRPPDKKYAPPDQEGAQEISLDNGQDAISVPPLTQQPLGLTGLPGTTEEINALAWALYNYVLGDPDGQKLITEMLKDAFGRPEILLGSAFLVGATCTLMEIRSRQTGEGRIPITPTWTPSLGNN
jgi:hypothetical protein